jgi:hypothetical protein
MAAAPSIRRVTPEVVGNSVGVQQTNIAADLMREFAQLESQRQNWEPYWADIARRIHPNANVFSRPLFGTSPAERRTEYIFESTSPLSLEGFAAILQELLFSSSRRWHKLSVPPSLEDDKESVAYLDAMTDILFQARYSSRSNFAANAGECMKDLGSFGTTSLFVDDAIGSHISYRAVPLQDLYFAVNNEGLVDRVFRKFLFSATQAVEQWGEANLSESVLKAYRTPGQEHREFEFMHAVRPRKNPEYRNKTFKGMPLESWYLCVNDRYIVEEGGYHTMPYATSRYTLSPREVYGRSPAMLVLADIKMLNEMSRTDINASQRAVDPAILLGEEGQRFSLRPGALNYGMVTDEGKPMAMPFNTDARVDISEEKMQKRREIVNKAFLAGMQDFIREHPDMPVSNMLQIAQEHGVLLSPVMGRQQNEFLGPIIRRELDILWRARQFDSLGPIPEGLMRAGGLIGIEYTSPLNKAQRAGEGVSIQQAIQQMTPIAEAGHPEVFDIFDTAALAREICEISDLPAKVMRSVEQMQALSAQKQQQAQIQGLIAAAPAAAGAAKDLADAHSTVMSAPQPVNP